MLEFAAPRIIRPAEARDLEPLKASLPKKEPDLHAERLAMQARGEAIYLLAVQNDVPVGRLLLRWGGAKDRPAAESLPADIPDVEDLFVHEAHRNRKVASRLLETAERLGAERGYKQIGLACGTENPKARELYETRGYADAGLPPYTIGAKFTDKEGKEQEWSEEVLYLVRSLNPPAATETENEMTSDEQIDTEATQTATATATEEPVESEPAKQTSERPITDQVVDFAFGVALTAAEVLEKAVESLSEKAKTVQKEAPAVWEAMQYKGRPAREKLVQSLREETKEEADAAAMARPSDAPVAEATPLTETPPIKPAPRPFGFGRTSSVSAEEEIKALEERVKTLEQEVAVVPTGAVAVAAEEGPEIVEDTINSAAPTPAEEGTALVDFTPETAAGDALTDSPYAVMDDEERASIPSQTGEIVSGPEPEAEAAPVAPKTRRTKKAVEPEGEAPAESEETVESEESAA